MPLVLPKSSFSTFHRPKAHLPAPVILRPRLGLGWKSPKETEPPNFRDTQLRKSLPKGKPSAKSARTGAGEKAEGEPHILGLERALI